MTATILQADARHLPLADATIDAICCDPPYEINFMSRSWDNAGVAFDPRTWREAYRVLKPGGHMLAFGGTRTWHRLTCAIEDAGFEIRDTIHCAMGVVAWYHGSGFPKSKNHLKPAWEPIVVARKPPAGTIAQNVLAYGTGALNIDATRIPTSAADAKAMERSNTPGSGRMKAGGSPIGTFVRSSATGAMDTTAGRWPTNVVISHQPLLDQHGRIIGDACDPICVAGCPAAELDAQSGTSASRSGGVTDRRAGGIMGATVEGLRQRTGHDDSGGASRFFPTFRYQAKADDWERPVINGKAHETVKPLALIRWLCRLITPPGGLILDPFAGSGTTFEAALMEGFHAVGGNNEPTYDQHIRYRIDRARRHLQPGVAKLARTKTAPQVNGQDGLFDLGGAL